MPLTISDDRVTRMSAIGRWRARAPRSHLTRSTLAAPRTRAAVKPQRCHFRARFDPPRRTGDENDKHGNAGKRCPTWLGLGLGLELGLGLGLGPRLGLGLELELDVDVAGTSERDENATGDGDLERRRPRQVDQR